MTSLLSFYSSMSRLGVRITYGIDTPSHNNPYHHISEHLLEGFRTTVDSTSFLVDTIPLCKSRFMQIFIHDLNVSLVKYLPEWFPGAYFQRRAKAWATSASQLLDRPFTEAQSLMVHSRRQPFIILYECSSVEVGTHSKMYCNNRFGKEYRNHKGPVLYRIYHQGIPCFSIPR